ncbi:hypothetical protein N7475_002702 [Penicillium sp. IBT 31633x]|nr:hypothetical protein N7475_002702 [Penicillium sp. IBT 31633x]
MDANLNEYEQPSLSSGTRKRKRSAKHDSSRARKKRKPALDELQKLLVTYRGLQQIQREVNESLAACEHEIAKYKLGSIARKSRRRDRDHPCTFQYARSPLSEEPKVEEEPPTFWGRMGAWLREWW